MPSTPKVVKPPKQFRVVFRDQREMLRDDKGNPVFDKDNVVQFENLPRLGYMIAYTPNTQTFIKQKKTQDEWAYGQGWHCQQFEREGKMWTREPEKDERGYIISPRNGGSYEMTVETMVPEHLQPIILDNEILEGFKIQHMVARYRGNKVWRILDPRGFELEILSGTFEDIVMSGLVDKGKIIGPCIWQTGKGLRRAESES